MDQGHSPNNKNAPIPEGIGADEQRKQCALHARVRSPMCRLTHTTHADRAEHAVTHGANAMEVCVLPPVLHPSYNQPPLASDSPLMRFATVAFLLVPVALSAQGTAADYLRADSLNRHYQGLAVDVAEAPHWVDANRFWYRKAVTGGNAFVVVDVSSKEKKPAFDHAKVAAAFAGDTAKITAVTLPFTTFEYADNGTAITFVAERWQWRCPLDTYACVKAGPAPQGGGRGRGGSPMVEDDSLPYEGPSPEEISAMEESAMIRQQPGGRGNAQFRDTIRVAPDGSRG